MNTDFTRGLEAMAAAQNVKLTLFDADMRAFAAAALGISSNALRLRVSGSQQLKALFEHDVRAPTATSVMTRDVSPIHAENTDLAEAVQAQSRALMRNGLLKAGISQETIDVLKTMEELAPNAGQFLVASVDLTHRMMVLQAVRLFEEAARIKKDYLDDAMLDDEMKIQWQGAYNEITDLLGKCFDRTLIGTQASKSSVLRGARTSRAAHSQ